MKDTAYSTLLFRSYKRLAAAVIMRAKRDADSADEKLRRDARDFLDSDALRYWLDVLNA